MKRAAAQIVKMLMSGNIFTCDKSGIACRYFKLSDNIGIKAYFSPGTAFGNFVYQRKLHARGITPDCWGLSSLKLDDDYTISAFFTEHVTVAYEIENRVPYSACGAFREWYLQERERVVREISMCGLEADDLHSGNFGVQNGKLVMIDIGYCCPKNSTEWNPIDKMFEERPA